jgi:hypothetical protein
MPGTVFAKDIFFKRMRLWLILFDPKICQRSSCQYEAGGVAQLQVFIRDHNIIRNKGNFCPAAAIAAWE